MNRKILIVVANFYKDISKSLDEDARKFLQKKK